MARNIKMEFCENPTFCKKKKFVKSTKQFSVKFLSNFCSFLIYKMGKVLRESIATFYGLHHDKGKLYTFKHFKTAVPKNTIYRIMRIQDCREPCILSLSSLQVRVSTAAFQIIFPEILNILQKKCHILPTKLYEFNQSQFQAET